jgi:hypothetical protein
MSKIDDDVKRTATAIAERWYLNRPVDPDFVGLIAGAIQAERARCVRLVHGFQPLRIGMPPAARERLVALIRSGGQP